MRIGYAFAAALALAGCSDKPADARTGGGLASTKDFFAAINANADGKALLDAYPVLNISPHGTCDVVIQTKQGASTIDWRKSGNLAASRIEGRLLTRLRGEDGGAHILDAPGDAVGERLQSSIGYLSSLCSN